jgi:tape measure domain-containing protein
MADNRITLVVEMQSGKAGEAVDSLNQKLRNIGTTSKKATQESADGFKRLQVEINQTLGPLNSMRAILGGFVSLGLGQLIGGMIRATNEIQAATVGLTKLTGGAQQAAYVLDQIDKISKSSPFRFGDLAETTRMMAAFKFQGSELLTMVKAIGDSAAALGGTKERLDQIALAFGQIKTKGRASAEELNRQLAEAGIPAVGYIAEALTQVEGRLVKAKDVLARLVKGEVIDSNFAIRAIVAGIQRDFGGLGKEVTEKTLFGQWAKTRDEMDRLGRSVGNELTPAMIGLMKVFRDGLVYARGFTDAMAGLYTTVSKLPSMLQSVAYQMAMVTAGVFALAVSFKALTGPGALATFAAFEAQFGRLAASAKVILTAAAVSAVVGSGWKTGQRIREVGPSDNTLGGGLPVPANVTAVQAMSQAGWRVAAKKWDDWMAGIYGTATSSDMAALETARNMASKPAGPKGLSLIDRVQADLKASKIPFIAKKDFWSEDANDYLEYLKNLKDTYKGLGDEADKVDTKLQSMWEQLRTKADQTMRQLTAAQFPGPLGQLMGVAGEYGHLRRKAGEFKGPERSKMLAEINRLQGQEYEIIGLENVKWWNEQMDKLHEDWFATNERVIKAMEQRDKSYVEAREGYGTTLAKEMVAGWQQASDATKQLALADLGQIQAVTVQEKISLEKRKFDIEVAALERSRQYKIAALNMEEQDEILKLEAQMRRERESEAVIAEFRGRIQDIYGQRRKVLGDQTRTEIELATKEANSAATQIVIDRQVQIFNSFKDQAGRVFDALLQKSDSVWGAIANSLKTAILTAIRDVVTSQVARMLMQLLGLGNVNLRGGGPMGIGAQPSVVGAGASAAGMMAMPFMGVGMDQQAYNNYLMGSGQLLAGGAGGGGGASAAVPFMGRAASSLAGMFGFGGNNGVQLGAGRAATGAWVWQYGSLADKLKAIGQSPAAIMGGAMVGLSGVQRQNMLMSSLGFGVSGYGLGAMLTKSAAGGWGGAMAGAGAGLMINGYQTGSRWKSIGGGALAGAGIGMMFGGPIGAAIGAGVGATVGLVTSFLKNGEQKVIDQVRSRYGITIDKTFARTLLEQSKQAGGIEMYLGSKQARDLIHLYAEMSGQRYKSGVLDDQARGVALQQSGGSLRQAGTYVGSTAYGYTSPLPSAGTLKPFAPAAAGGAPIYLDASETRTFWTDVVSKGVIQNPRGIQDASVQATTQSSGRVAAAINLSDPLAVTI